MNQNNITIAIDAMGGDNSPFKCLKGAEIFNTKIQNIKIILLGDANVGKTTFTNLLVTDSVSMDYHSTIGVEFISTGLEIGFFLITLPSFFTQRFVTSE